MATQLLFTVTCSLMKLSILVTYLREQHCILSGLNSHSDLGIFPSKLNRVFCYVLLAYTTAWLFGAFFLVLFQCL